MSRSTSSRVFLLILCFLALARALPQVQLPVRGPPRDRSRNQTTDRRLIFRPPPTSTNYPIFTWPTSGHDDGVDSSSGKVYYGKKEEGHYGPRMEVIFPDGRTDVVEMREHLPITGSRSRSLSSGDRRHCVYLGRLASEPRTSSVAVTGCVGSDDHDRGGVEVTVTSKTGHGGQFMLSGDGHVVSIPDPFEESRSTSLPVPGGDHRFIQSSLQEFEQGWYINEADELVNMDYMKLAEKMSDVCSKTQGFVIELRKT